jgi:hypothetical protein
MRELAEKHRGFFVNGVPRSMTVDGVHHTAAGRREWKRRVQAAGGAKMIAESSSAHGSDLKNAMRPGA